MLALVPLFILAGSLLAPNTGPGEDRWQLVFEDDFTADTDPTADWTRFGDTSPQSRGRNGQ